MPLGDILGACHAPLGAEKQWKPFVCFQYLQFGMVKVEFHMFAFNVRSSDFV